MSGVTNISEEERGKRWFLFSLANLIFFSSAGLIRFGSLGFFFTARRFLLVYFIVVFILGGIGLWNWQGDNIKKVLKGAGLAIQFLVGLVLLYVIGGLVLGLVWEILKWLFAA